MAALIGLALMVTIAQAEEIETIAQEAGVDPVDLQGAVNTTGLPPRVYLAVTTPEPPAVSYGIWDRLAACESSGRWSANTGNGYYGGLQEDMTFWRRHGGLAYASRPDLASRTAQISVAIRGQLAQGWGAWPNCSRRLGLR